MVQGALLTLLFVFLTYETKPIGFVSLGARLASERAAATGRARKVAAGAAGERPTPAPPLRARHGACRTPPPDAPRGKGGPGGRGAPGAPPRKKTPAACRRPLSPRRRKRATTARRRRPLWSHKGAAHEPRPRRNGGAVRPKGRGRAL